MAKKNFYMVDLRENEASLLKATGTNSIESVLAMASGNISSEKSPLSEGISAELKKWHWRNEPLIVILPRRAFIFKNLILPSQDFSEIKKIMALQLSEHIPYKEEEVLWEVNIVEQMPDGHSRILFMAISLETLQGRLNHLPAGHIPKMILVSSWAALGWAKVLGGPSASARAVIILTVIGYTAEMCFCDQQKLFFSRQFNFEKGTPQEGEQYFNEQVLLSLKAYLKEKMGPVPTTLFGLGSLALNEELKGILKSSFSIQCVLVDPSKEFPKSLLNKNVQILPQQASNDIHLLGMIQLDFKTIPHFRTQTPSHLGLTDQWRSRLNGLLLVLIIVVAGLSVIFLPIVMKSLHLSKLRNQVAMVQPALQNARSSMRQYEAMREILLNRVIVVDLLSEIHDLTPLEISYKSIRLNNQGELTLEGQATAISAVNVLQNKLLGSGHFRNVNLSYANKRITAMGEFTFFSIKMVINKKVN